MIAAAHQTMMGPQAAPSSLDYVQDSAVMFFDGIENAGRGVHNATATSWTNLGSWGGGANATSGLSGNWLDDAFSFNQSGGFAFSLSSVAWLTGDITIEVAYRVASEGTWAGRVIGTKDTGVNNNQRMSYYPTWRDATWGADIVWGGNTSYQVPTGDKGTDYPKRTTAAIVGSTSHTGISVRCRGVSTQYTTQFYPHNRATNITIGNEGDLSRPLLGEVCAFRLHGRSLTDAEIDANAALDRQRFGVT